MQTLRIFLLVGLFICATQTTFGQEQKPAKTKHELVIEAPGITCKGRFKESLQKHFLKKYDWVQSLEISYKPEKQFNLKNSFPGETAIIRFTVKNDPQKMQLLKLLHSSGFYVGTDKWQVIQKKTLLEMLKEKEVIKLPILGRC